VKSRNLVLQLTTPPLALPLHGREPLYQAIMKVIIGEILVLILSSTKSFEFLNKTTPSPPRGGQGEGSLLVKIESNKTYGCDSD